VHGARAFKRGGCRILMYHRFSADQSQLAVHCEHIRRYYQPVSMRQVAESFHGGPALPSNALAVTVDDGYRDFLLHGYPVFSRYEIPSTVFLITGFIDRELWPWWDQITYMFAHTRRSEISFAGLELHIAGDLFRVGNRAAFALKSVANSERLVKLKELQRKLEVELPHSAPAEYEPLSWNDVRQLSAAGVEFGGHTRTHPILSRVSAEAEVMSEIDDAKKRLDDQLGFPSLHFAYPNGTPGDYTPQIVAVVRDCGFTTAVTAKPGLNYRGADPHELLRLWANPSLTEKHFAELLAGLRTY
jgi:peptidoglycan/xylan/chitin deacetylase (PgdA/CDA1 family)